jgi:hypothetical protein
MASTPLDRPPCSNHAPYQVNHMQFLFIPDDWVSVSCWPEESNKLITPVYEHQGLFILPVLQSPWLVSVFSHTVPTSVCLAFSIFIPSAISICYQWTVMDPTFPVWQSCLSILGWESLSSTSRKRKPLKHNKHQPRNNIGYDRSHFFFIRES